VLAVGAAVISEALLGLPVLATAHGSVVKIVGGVITIIAARGAWMYERRRRQRD
jgi:predicted nucleic acid-binding Zn ribbon protein